MIPEIHNIIARWNKEAGVENTGVKIKEVTDDEIFEFKEVVISIFTVNPGRLIGKQGCLIKKYKDELTDFYHERHPKLDISIEIELTVLDEMVNQEEVDVDKYYNALINHVSFDVNGEV